MAPLYQRLLVGLPFALLAYWGLTCPCNEVMKCHWEAFWGIMGAETLMVLIFNNDKRSNVCIKN